MAPFLSQRYDRLKPRLRIPNADISRRERKLPDTCMNRYMDKIYMKIMNGMHTRSSGWNLESESSQLLAHIKCDVLRAVLQRSLEIW